MKPGSSFGEGAYERPFEVSAEMDVRGTILEPDCGGDVAWRIRVGPQVRGHRLALAEFLVFTIR